MSELEPLESDDRHGPSLATIDHSAWLENSFHLLERMEIEHSTISRGKRTSFDALLSKNQELLEKSFSELDQLESRFDAFQINSSVHFKSRLQAKLLRKQISIDENEACAGSQDIMTVKSSGGRKVLRGSESFDERLKQKMRATTKVASLANRLNNRHISKCDMDIGSQLRRYSNERETSQQNVSKCDLCVVKVSASKPGRFMSRKLNEKESFEERQTKKINESATNKVPSSPSFPPKPSPRPPHHFTRGIVRRMSHSDLSESTDESMSSNNHRNRSERKIRKGEKVEDRLKRKMAGSRVVAPSSKNAVEERLKRKTKESTKPSSLPPVASRSIAAKESFEERLREKMSDSTNTGPLEPVPQYEERLRKKMSESETTDMVRTGLKFHDRLEAKIRAREAVEERLKKKMAESNASKNARSSTETRALTAKVSFGERAKSKMGAIESQQLVAKEYYEEHLKRKINESNDVPSTSRNSSSAPVEYQNMIAKELFEERLKRKMAESATVPSKNGITPVESRRTTAKESYEERLKKKMSESSDEPFKDESRNMTVKESHEERLNRKMRESDAVLSNDATDPGKSSEQASEIKARDLFEDRLRKKMEDSTPAPLTTRNSHQIEEPLMRSDRSDTTSSSNKSSDTSKPFNLKEKMGQKFQRTKKNQGHTTH
mmetsp:Transcript_27210/g.56685  ORF Transcript_27210/g.56685 Transcript_27210/m.56685 type:complete len:664 (+) Transcript_27210:90-2081(+)